MYSLLANIQIAHARQAPKIILPDARERIHSNAVDSPFTLAVNIRARRHDQGEAKGRNLPGSCTIS